MMKLRLTRDMAGAEQNDVVYESFAEFARDVVTTANDPTDTTRSRLRLNAHEVRAYAAIGTTRDEFLKMEQRTASGLGEAVPADGGFLLAPQWARELVLRSYQESAVLRRCTEWQVSDTNRAGLKFPAVDETSRADGSRWGGARSYWANEADAVTASKPKFTNVELNPKKVLILSYLTNELLGDMGALGNALMLILSKETAFRVTDAVVVGDGAGKPQGVKNSPAKIAVTRSGGNAIVTADVLSMLKRFWVGSRTDTYGKLIDGSVIGNGPKPCWLVHSDAVDQLATLAISVGGGGSAAFLYDPCDGDMMGYPVIPIEQCQALGTEGDIILADFNEYQLAWRSRGQLDVSMHLNFTTDESVMRLVTRVDGQGSWNTAVTPLNGSNTQSPFVTLN